MQYFAEEMRICAISLYCGMLIGLIYDTLAFLSLPLSRCPAALAAVDMLFYALAGIAAALALLYATQGRLRLYALLLIAAGAFLYCRYPMRLWGACIRARLLSRRKAKRGLLNKRENRA